MTVPDPSIRADHLILHEALEHALEAASALADCARQATRAPDKPIVPTIATAQFLAEAIVLLLSAMRPGQMDDRHQKLYADVSEFLDEGYR